MAHIGMTRRIDELGRLVIPKEIRNNLKIKDNDQIEINILNNKIILSKYDVLKKDDIIHQILLSIKKLLNKNILFTSRDKIIDHSLLNKGIINNNDLSNEVMMLIENRKEVINSQNLNLYDAVNSQYSIINPLIVNGDLYGSLVLFSNIEIQNNDIWIMRFVKDFLENYLE